MSVINKMLRDLDARHAGDRKSLPNEVRPLPEETRRSPPLMAITGALILVGIAGWAWWITSENTHPAPPLAVTPPSPAPVPTPPPVAAVAEPTAAPVAPAPAATAEPAAAAPVVAQSATPTAPPPAATAAVAAPPAPLPAAPAPTAEPASKAPAPAPIAKEAAAKEPAAKKTETTSAKRAAPAGLSSLRLETSLRQIPSMAETAPAKSAGPVEKQLRGGANNEQAEAAYRKAAAANRQGRNSEAVDALRDALRADPRHVSARQLLLSLLVERKQWDEATTLLREGLELLPQQSAWAMALARIEVEKGQLPQAWETLQRYLPAAESNADYRGFAGALLQRLQKPKEAILHYQAAVRLKPAESRWWLGLGMALEADGRAAEAREAYQKAQAAGNLGAEGTALVEQKLR